MSDVEILRRKRLSSGWVLYEGDVNGKNVGIRIPQAYVETVSDNEADNEVKQSLKEEYERQRDAR